MNRLVILLKALADDNRLKIIELLLGGDLCVGALAHRLGISRAAASQHLQILSNAGLINGERRGHWMHYMVDKGALEEISRMLVEMMRPRKDVELICLKGLPMAREIFDKRRLDKMCMDCCQRPEKLKGKTSECSPEQIKECHGDKKGHPCVVSKGGEKRKDV
ncbi:MAG: hypothetical protein DRH12_11960 [Deltaproteobacteria bacterium]|nr:MAG: hypothetical protein DRH12_11960 [Deltaproteobacteria bacterium]